MDKVENLEALVKHIQEAAPLPRPRQRWRPGLIVWTLLASVLLLVTAPLWLPAMGYYLHTPNADVPMLSADAIVVLGGNDERTRYAINLYHEQDAPQFWHTGISRSQPAIAHHVNSHGVPLEDFRWLVTTSTWEDGAAAAERIKQEEIDQVVLITDWWHSRRALCSLQVHLGGYPVEIAFRAPASHYGPENWWHSRRQISNVLSEVGKSGYYWVRYGMAPTVCSPTTPQ